tara:strand:- start:405 stop:1631 length:1227 start_codon:yes stop_codon:yes gene_type:complete
MPHVTQEDIIGYIDNTIDVIQGDSQVYTIKLYRDSIGGNLNTSIYSSFTMNLLDASSNLIAQYAMPRVYGVSGELNLINTDPETQGVFQFELAKLQTLNLPAGKIYVNIVVTSDRITPTKIYSLPNLEIGSILFNENRHDPSLYKSTQRSSGIGVSASMDPYYKIQHIDGSIPIGQGHLSLNSGSPGLVTNMTFMNSDFDGIRVSVLENFLINRIDKDGIEGTITLINRNDTAQYSIFNVVDWYRVNCGSGNCVDDLDDALQLIVAHETSTEGPGVHKNNWLVTDEISFKLDVYGSALSPSDLGKKSSTVLDKELIPNNTSGNVSRTGIILSVTPEDGQYIDVEINGISISLGDGTKNLDGYFSADGGTTSRTFEDIRVGDELIFNAVIAGYELTDEDRVSLFYESYS